MFKFALISCLLALGTCSWVPGMENPGLYEGDMVLNPEQMLEVEDGTFTFSSTGNKNKLWPNGVVPYTMSSDLARSSEFMSEFQHSIDQYHKYTCIRFKKRSNERGYIHFYAGGGCSSPVGYRGSKNTVSLSKGCWWRSTIMHEIGHSLGFHHEQSRPDRDNYVTIQYQNVARGTEHNFRKQQYSDVNSQGTPYDFMSMMHYSWDAFGSGKMTIKTKNPAMQYEIGNGIGDRGFSHIDIEQINKLYSCRGSYPTLPPYTNRPTAECHDLRPCAKHVFKGECKSSSWRSYLSKHCRLSCGFCESGPQPSQGPRPTSGGGSGNCRDVVSDCAKLGRHRCSDSNRAWRDYMARSCKKYCNKC